MCIPHQTSSMRCQSSPSSLLDTSRCCCIYLYFIRDVMVLFFTRKFLNFVHGKYLDIIFIRSPTIFILFNNTFPPQFLFNYSTFIFTTKLLLLSTTILLIPNNHNLHTPTITNFLCQFSSSTKTHLPP